MTFTINSTHIENDELSLTENSNGNLVLEHKPTGQTVMLDGTAVDVGGDDFTTTGAVNAASASVTNGVTAGSVEAERRHNTHYIPPSDDPQAIIDASVAGETVVFTKGIHTITSPLVVDKPLTIKGEGSGFVGTQPNPSSGITSFDGAVIEQQTAGANVLEFPTSAHKVDVEDLILTWEGTIAETDTGHGIYAVPPDDVDGIAKKAGLTTSTFENIVIESIDGDHYGLYCVNPQQWTLTHVRALNGGGFYVEQNHQDTNFGNMVFNHCTNILRTDGTADAWNFTAIDRTLNLITLIRPQTVANVDTSLTGQKAFRIEDSNTGANVSGMGVICPNFEGANSEVDRPGHVDDVWLPALVEGTQNGNRHILKSGGFHLKDNFCRLPKLSMENNAIANIDQFDKLSAKSSVPASPNSGDVYLDDGTNTGDANPHFRYYDGTAWNDL